MNTDLPVGRQVITDFFEECYAREEVKPVRDDKSCRGQTGDRQGGKC